MVGKSWPFRLTVASNSSIETPGESPCVVVTIKVSPGARVNLLTGGRVFDLHPKCPAQPTSEPVLAVFSQPHSQQPPNLELLLLAHQLRGGIFQRRIPSSSSSRRFNVFVFRLPLCPFPSVSSNHHLWAFGRHRPGASQGFSQSCCFPRRWFPFSLFCHPHSASLAAPSFVIALYVLGHSLRERPRRGN